MKHLFILFCSISFVFAMDQNQHESWYIITPEHQSSDINEVSYVMNISPRSTAEQKELTFFQKIHKKGRQLGDWANQNPGTSSSFILGGTFCLGAFTGAAGLYLLQRLKSE